MKTDTAPTTIPVTVTLHLPEPVAVFIEQYGRLVNMSVARQIEDGVMLYFLRTTEAIEREGQTREWERGALREARRGAGPLRLRAR